MVSRSPNPPQRKLSMDMSPLTLGQLKDVKKSLESHLFSFLSSLHHLAPTQSLPLSSPLAALDLPSSGSRMMSLIKLALPPPRNEKLTIFQGFTCERTSCRSPACPHEWCTCMGPTQQLPASFLPAVSDHSRLHPIAKAECL